MTTHTPAQTDALPPPPPQDAAAALLAAATALWPPPIDVAVAKATAALPTGHRLVREHILIPNAKHPRLIVPSGSHRTGAAIAARRHGSGGRADRLAGRVAVTAVRTGVAERVFRDRLRMTVDENTVTDDVESTLRTLLGTEVTVGLHVGTARVNRKPVLHAVDQQGRTVAFVKVGHSPATRALVDQEAASLQALAAHPFRTLMLPRVLAHETWRDYRLLVLSPLHGRVLAPSADNPPYDAMQELAAVHGLTEVPISTSAFVNRLAHVTGELSPAIADRFGAALTRLRAHDATVTMGAWHGDWQPFNMARLGHGRFALWDWERFATDVPVGLDALHYVQQSLIHGRGVGPHIERDFLVRADDVAVRGGAHEETARIVVASYVADIAARYLVLAEGPDGELLARRAMWSLGLLESCVARL